MKTVIKRVARNQAGASLVEYALVIALVALVSIIGVSVLGLRVVVNMDEVGDVLSAGDAIQGCNDELPPGVPGSCS